MVRLYNCLKFTIAMHHFFVDFIIFVCYTDFKIRKGSVQITIMNNSKHPRGFITIAVGNEYYYDLAKNLLRSFRVYDKSGSDFSVICDRICDQVKDFDNVILLEKPSYSFLDKLELLKYTPYEETIFIDSDSLFVSDPDKLWEDFSSSDDFSCYGKALPLNAKNGWFYYEGTGEFKPYIDFIVKMHGGLYYFKKTERTKEIFTRAKYIIDNYSEFKFAHFDKPADEPAFALSMAISHCKPFDEDFSKIFFLPSYEGKVKITKNAELKYRRKDLDAVVIHFATINTRRFIYRYLNHATEMLYKDKEFTPKSGYYLKLKLKTLTKDIKIPTVRRIKRFVKYSLPPSVRKIISAILK